MKTLESFPDLVVGSVVADCVIEEELARGGMGIVFRARRNGGRDVALKVPRRDNLDDDEKLSHRILRFGREVRLMRRVDHPGVARIIDDGEVLGLPYLTMELVDGEAFGEAFSGSEIDASCEVIENAAQAVHRINEMGIVHRDVKPGNILVREDRTIVMIDFGLAHDATGVEPVIEEGGFWLGTPAYGPPEQIHDGTASTVDARADVYALATVLYEALAGETPYGFDFLEVYRNMEKPPRPVRLLRPDCPELIEAAVMRGISRDPADRFASALEFADALGAARKRA